MQALSEIIVKSENEMKNIGGLISRLLKDHDKIIDEIEKKNIGKRKTLFRLKDWGISRQRYWGCPIPCLLYTSPSPRDS